MSSFEFRASVPSDAPAILELCRSSLGIADDSPMLDPALLAWKYWQPWPTWSGPRSYVLTRADVVIAHIAAIPVTYEVDGGRCTLLHPLDWAARPLVVGAGAALLQRLASVADGVLVVGGSSMTQRMLGPLGYRRLPDVRRYAARPRAQTAHQSQLRALPDSASPPGLEGVFAPSWAALRTPALFELWRTCPAISTKTYEVVEDGAVRGGFLIARSPGQARLIDTWCASPAAADWARIFELARNAASSFSSASEVVTLANTALEAEGLLAAGFQECGVLPMFVRTTRSLPPAPAVLRFQMLDGDCAFLHDGRTERWLEP